MNAEKRDTIWNKDFILLLTVNAFVFISMHMLTTTIAKFSMVLNGTEAVAGMVAGVFSVSSIIVRPICGNIIDRKHKKRIYLAAMCIILVGILGYSICASNLMLVVFRMIHGVGWGFATTVGMTMASNTAPESRVGEAVGVYGLANVLAMAMAPTLGLYISDNFGYPPMFLASAFFILIALILLGQVRNQPIPENIPKARISIDTILLREAILPATVLVLAGMAYNAITTFLIAYSQQAGIANPSMFFSVYSVVILFVRLVSGRIVDKKGPEYIILPGGVFFVGCLCLLGGLRNSAMLYAAAVCLGFGYSATLSTLMAVAFKRTIQSRRGIASSTINVGMDVGTGIGSTVAGMLVMRFNYSTMYYLLCIPVVLSVLIFVADQWCFARSEGLYRKNKHLEHEGVIGK